MLPCYTLKVTLDFAAAHQLRDYPGECSQLHGHNWKLEVEIEANALDDMGMGLDFKVIKEHARAVTDRLDHQHLNELEPFVTVNPTAENIAAYIYRELGTRLNNDRVRVGAITLWETERACVRYTEKQENE